MEARTLATLEEINVRNLISTITMAHERPDWRTVTFEGYPTAMLIRPCEEDPGSLHYMHFPPLASQRFHFHPSVRFLIILGDVPVYVQHSAARTESNPYEKAAWTELAPFTLSVARIPERTWHRFETRENDGVGAVAFTVHGDDGIPLDKVTSGLMSEVTVYFDGHE